ncbi:MAG: hypothetical protein A2X49_03840 [Lentisphaerae bacterium GWF2_52_8]|nr:MAG: hypothetical protein A2X49_03840 [Lentisphaerae bacterium GWF2_52_8]
MSKYGLRKKIRFFFLLGIAGSIFVVAGLITLCILEIEDSIYAQGKITPEHAFEIVGHIDGRVVRLYHEPGDDLAVGELIAKIDSSKYEEEELAMSSAIRELEAELSVKEAELAVLEKEPLPKELWYAETNLKECEGKSALAKDKLERYKKLATLNAISKIELQQAEFENIQRTAELERARENSRKIREGLAFKILEKTKCDISLTKAKIESKKAALEVCRKHIAESRIIAPAAGRLTELPCRTTMYVEKGKLAARLASGLQLKATAEVDERVIRKVKPGQKVRVFSEVYNRLQYGCFYGTVDHIKDIPNEKGKYAVEVLLDTDGRDLKLGSGVEVAIVSGTQSAILALLGFTKEDSKPKRPQHRMAKTQGTQPPVN